MKEEKIPCRIIRYREFPDLLFGTLREDGPVYFDATRFIQAKGDARRHNVRDFRVAFHHWATALADAYGIDREKMIIRDEASGHLLIDECLALLFVVYIDPAFGVYLLWSAWTNCCPVDLRFQTLGWYRLPVLDLQRRN